MDEFTQTGRLVAFRKPPRVMDAEHEGKVWAQIRICTGPSLGDTKTWVNGPYDDTAEGRNLGRAQMAESLAKLLLEENE